MPTVKTTPTSSKRRRSSGEGSHRATERHSTDRPNRRFAVNGVEKKRGIPLPVTSSRKAKKVQDVLHVMVTGACFFIMLSVIFTWRHRTMNRMGQAGRPEYIAPKSGRSISSFFSLQHARRQNDTAEAAEAQSRVSEQEEAIEIPREKIMRNEREAEATKPVLSQDKTTEDSEHNGAEKAVPQDDADASKNDDEATPDVDQSERIEWYSRDDYKDGSRPMCRISKPFILSNGTILVPEWMAKYDKLLSKCGLGSHSFYSPSTGPVGLERQLDIPADFVLTVHPEKFQEPTHVSSVYLTEHILKSSYLFDVFSGNARPVDGVKEHHCRTTAETSICTNPRPIRSALNPAIFVPKRIEMAPRTLWSRQMVDMFGAAHGRGSGALHLNASTILLKSHKEKSEGLIGTGFHSIMVTDGMFRHLPAGSLKASSFYSPKNGISKTPKPKDGATCNMVVGIASGEEETGIDKANEIKDRIIALSKMAIPKASVEATLVEFARGGDLQEHIKEMQNIDVYLGGSGDQMSSIGYLRSSSSVFELAPFGIKPNTHESLARALELEYERIGGKPQVETFKNCIDGEVFNMRKKGKLQFSETPKWQDPLMEAWDKAAAEYALTGHSDFDILTHPELKSYYSRVCALKQKVEVGIDETARQIVLFIKQKCQG